MHFERILSFLFQDVVLFRMNSFGRTSICTGSAVNASFWVDDIFGITLRDCFIGALVNTSSTLNTVVTNYVSHFL